MEGERESERGWEEGEKRGMRVILIRNDWRERGGGGGGECKHSYCERVSCAWFFRVAFVISELVCMFYFYYREIKTHISRF